ncbi:Pheromone-regulated membrane protein 6 [Madurella mycetomatis]|uniref:Pheromone-regulated membrane protein 6 n=1 Tax=Madurella mycetomatis TaxID=100816 RepID=A0A150ASC5_9PEZI|nr:Pheromone-regulated membrane protein 6 [Madurella mycetomatis]
MGFLSHRRRDAEVHPEQKWDFISLNDFKSTSCFAPFAYGYLLLTLLTSVAVYAVDTFTAYQLLAFNKWSSAVEPAQIVPFDISKWIFTICIILSFVNLGFEYLRAVRIMRRGSVAESFLDSLAARLECIRFGKGRGWRRFLVFAELTKSKKGAEYIALFTFFSFQSWIRVLLCSGPRQAINALTLYSLYNDRLQIQGSNFETSLSSFFDKLRALATEETQQAVILSGMLFTLVIWIFSFLSLLLAALFFVFFLWSYIPREDGGLTGFCERKVNKRLKQIVSIKINKAMADEEEKRKRAEFKAAKKNGEARPMTMQPSLPVLGDDSLPEMPSLKRTDTFASLSEKPSRPNTPGSFEMSALGQKPMRSATVMTSTSQYSVKSSLVGGAAEMGVTRSGSPIPTLPSIDLEGYSPLRSATGASNGGLGPGPGLQRMASNGSSLSGGYAASRTTYGSETMPGLPPPVRSPVNAPNGYRGPGPNQARDRWPGANEIRSPFDDYSSGRGSPAPSMTSYRSNPMSPRGIGPDGYPIRSATNPVSPRGPPQFPPPRNMTAPMRPFHQPTGSNGSLRSMPSASQPYHQQSPSNSSLRNMVPAGTYPQVQTSGEYEYVIRPNPMTANSPRGPPRGFGNGWNQDVERGSEPRY